MNFKIIIGLYFLLFTLLTANGQTKYKLLTPPLYQVSGSNGDAKSFRDNKAVIVDSLGNELPINDKLLEEDYYVYRDRIVAYFINEKKQRKSVLLDRDGKATSEIYDFIGSEDIDGYYVVGNKEKNNLDNKLGVIDKHGNTIIPLLYDQINYHDNRMIFCSNLAVVKLYGKSGLVNKSGKVILSCSYDNLRYNNEKKCFYSFFDNSDLIFDKNLDTTRIFRNTSWLKGGKGQILDVKTGIPILPYIYDILSPFGNNTFYGLRENREEIIGKKGQIIVPLGKYRDIGHLYEGKAYFQTFDNKFGYINELGIEVIPAIYDKANNFTESKNAIVSVNGKYGCIDTVGNVVIPLEYDTIDYNRLGNFKDLFVMKKAGKVSWIIAQTKLPLTGDYRYMYDCSNSLIYRNSNNSKFGLLDYNFNRITGLIFDFITCYGGNYPLFVKVGDKWGLLNSKGQTVVPAIYDNIYPGANTNHVVNNSNFFWYKENGKWGLLKIY